MDANRMNPDTSVSRIATLVEEEDTTSEWCCRISTMKYILPMPAIFPVSGINNTKAVIHAKRISIQGIKQNN